METVNEKKVIRSLGLTESFYDFEVQNGSMLISRAFLISCSNEYDLNLDVVKQACSHWIKFHPFLQSYIYREHLEKSNYFEIEMKKYFVSTFKLLTSCLPKVGLMFTLNASSQCFT